MNRPNKQSLKYFEKAIALIKRMEMENTVYTFAGVNCRLKVVNKENGEEIFFDNLGEVNLFLSQTVSYLRLFC